MKALIIGAVFIILVSIFRTSAFALSLTLENTPLTADQDQELEIKVNLSCSGCSDSYLRGVFYPSGTKYFGYTQDNSGVWSNASGGSCTTFFKVASGDLQNGSWSGTLKFKPDSKSSYYEGPGEYLFKVGRYSYTTSCGSSPTWSSDSTIALTGPTSTPTPNPTSTPEPTSTKTPTPIKTLTPTKSPTPTKTPTPTKDQELKDEKETSILGTSSTVSKEPTKEEVKVASSNTNFTGTFFVLAGIVFSILCGIVILWPRIKPYLNRDAKDNNE